MKKKLFIACCLSQLIAIPAFANAEDEGFGCLNQIEKRVVSADPDFTYLNLESCNLQDKDMKNVANFLNEHRNINGLLLNNNDRLTEVGISELANSSSVTAISLNNIQHDVAKAVAKNTALEFVSIENGDIHLEDVAALASMPNLKLISLNKNDIGNNGAKILAKNQQLMLLSVDNCDIGAAGATAFANMHELRGLSINGNNIRDAGAIALAKHNEFDILLMDSNHIGDQGANALASMAKNFIVTLDHNDINDAGAISLANNSSGYFVLNLSYNLFSEVGLNALIKAQNDGRIFSLGVSGYTIQENMKAKTLGRDKMKWSINKFCNAKNYTFCKNLITKSFKF